MCKCLKEKEIFAKEKLAEYDDYYKNATVDDVSFKHTLEIFLSRLNLPITVTGIRLVKGEQKKFKKELYYPATFCPFCGERWIKEKSE